MADKQKQTYLTLSEYYFWVIDFPVFLSYKWCRLFHLGGMLCTSTMRGKRLVSVRPFRSLSRLRLNPRG